MRTPNCQWIMRACRDGHQRFGQRLDKLDKVTDDSEELSCKRIPCYSITLKLDYLVQQATGQSHRINSSRQGRLSHFQVPCCKDTHGNDHMPLTSLPKFPYFSMQSEDFSMSLHVVQKNMLFKPSSCGICSKPRGNLIVLVGCQGFRS